MIKHRLTITGKFMYVQKCRAPRDGETTFGLQYKKGDTIIRMEGNNKYVKVYKFLPSELREILSSQVGEYVATNSENEHEKTSQELYDHRDAAWAWFNNGGEHNKTSKVDGLNFYEYRVWYPKYKKACGENETYAGMSFKEWLKIVKKETG